VRKSDIDNRAEFNRNTIAATQKTAQILTYWMSGENCAKKKHPKVLDLLELLGGGAAITTSNPR
jgi:hypothetical protein